MTLPGVIGSAALVALLHQRAVDMIAGRVFPNVDRTAAFAKRYKRSLLWAALVLSAFTWSAVFLLVLTTVALSVGGTALVLAGAWVVLVPAAMLWVRSLGRRSGRLERFFARAAASEGGFQESFPRRRGL